MMKKQMFSVRGLCISASIAAVYTLLTYLLAPISYGAVQFRVSEALTLLPVLLPEAIPGLFVGCLLANLLNPEGVNILDVIFGSLASLVAAAMTYSLRKNRWLAALPPVLVNGIVVGIILHITYGLPLLETMGYVALGQFAVCYALGIPLISALTKVPFLSDLK